MSKIDFNNEEQIIALHDILANKEDRLTSDVSSEAEQETHKSQNDKPDTMRDDVAIMTVDAVGDVATSIHLTRMIHADGDDFVEGHTEVLETVGGMLKDAFDATGELITDINMTSDDLLLNELGDVASTIGKGVGKVVEGTVDVIGDIFN